MDERLAPGPELPEGEPQALCDDGLWVPQGQADAVVFLGERRHKYVQDGYLHKEILFPSLERQALRFLRPCSERWHSLNPGMVGVSRPDGMQAHFPRELENVSNSEARPLRWLVCSESKGLFDAKNAEKWKWYKVDEGIWAGLFE